MTTAATPDEVAEAAKKAGLHGHLIQSNLTDEQEAKLKEAYGS